MGGSIRRPSYRRNRSNNRKCPNFCLIRKMTLHILPYQPCLVLPVLVVVLDLAPIIAPDSLSSIKYMETIKLIQVQVVEM